MAKRTKSESAGQIIARRRLSALNREGYAQLLVRVLFLALVFWLLFSQVFLVTRATGNGMFPSVKDGDLLLGYRLQESYAKDDVVVFSLDGSARVGRIAARGGDTVYIDESGNITVNNTAQTGEILYPTYPKEGLEYPYHVPEGSVFILCDYRTQTEDSRDYGPVPVEDIQAKVISILRRRGL